MQSDAQSAINKFAPVARDSCELIDSAAEMDRHAFILELTIRLARICEAGASLSTIKLVNESADEDEQEFTDHAKNGSILLPKLPRIFGKDDPYWSVFDPTSKEEPVQGTLSDDIADIYLDLKEALSQISSGADANDICFDL